MWRGRLARRQGRSATSNTFTDRELRDGAQPLGALCVARSREDWDRGGCCAQPHRRRFSDFHCGWGGHGCLLHRFVFVVHRAREIRGCGQERVHEKAADVDILGPGQNQAAALGYVAMPKPLPAREQRMLDAFQNASGCHAVPDHHDGQPDHDDAGSPGD